MKKKYQIFISSTFIDLVSIRNIAYQTILEMGQIPVGYNDIASEKSIKESISPLINSSEIFVLIIGERYGSITENGFSYIEEEYNYALSKGKPILCFIKSDYAKNDDPRYHSFVNELLKKHLISLWNNEDDFKAKLATSIYTLITKSPPDTYWVKQYAQRTNEQSEIDKYYNDVADAIGLNNVNKDDNDILGLIALNLKELKEFYTLTKKQAIRSFSLSVSMCILGFLLIIFSSIIALFWNENQIAITTGIGGSIVEVIAGTSLFVYKKSLEQLNFYYLSLHDNERFMSLINISSKTNSKDDLYSKIVVSELERLKLVSKENSKS
ncbi:DUF4062 domain-containing protein [Desulfosporosinus sp. OT]|uniref:DUF4062 domain-containing protein n=1 Tax=Desulfosporosinus sp. OT TaxID=913865 RepID=UPI0002E82170|nr:DUF4062 domain-containing protein [Desulfosporosinus sp. OT]